MVENAILSLQPYSHFMLWFSFTDLDKWKHTKQPVRVHFLVADSTVYTYVWKS